MKSAAVVKRAKAKTELEYIIHIDGAGQGPFGTGSGYAWFDVDTGKSEVIWKDHLTNNQAEYRALRLAVKRLKRGSSAKICSDSQLVVNQFNSQWAVNDPDLRKLLQRIHEIIEERELDVVVKWIPREQNQADNLLSKKNKK